MTDALPYCPGCDASTIPRWDKTCPWCDTDLSSQISEQRISYRDNANSVLTASVFSSHVGQVAMLERQLAAADV